MTFHTIVGYPRIGANRELKRAEEAYWSGKSTRQELESVASGLRLKTYQHLQELGLKDDWSIPMSFSYYDQVLDAALAFGAVPERFEKLRTASTTDYSLNAEGNEREVGSFSERMRRPIDIDEFDLDAYFTIARGVSVDGQVKDLPGEMSKWFDTNYHYIVPELGKNTRLSLAYAEIFRQFEEALEAGFKVRPTLVGPVTFLALAKYDGVTYAQLLSDMIAVYARIISKLNSLGAKWVQFDEPALVSQSHALNDHQMNDIMSKVYGELAQLQVGSERPNLLVTTPFGSVNEALIDTFAKLPVEALHIDVNRADSSDTKEVLSAINSANPSQNVLLGIVNGRNIWRADLGKLSDKVNELKTIHQNVTISTSCSLQHTPHTIDLEPKLKADFPELLTNLSFADEKVQEVVALANGTCLSRPPAEALEGRELLAVSERLAGLSDADVQRESIEERKSAQAAVLNLPLLPTTTIGSFPQTSDIRKARADFKKGIISALEYENAMKSEIKQCVELQEELDIDVLVHGEAERNDMVQYFAENFEGFDVTENGWVQSYGSRCTKPSVLWGDVYREKAFTVSWISYAQSLTDRVMKGMLTGPVTILAWSFVRDDQPLGVTANQVALALRDEISDLEDAGIKIIQVDEPALRELLPLKKAQQSAYLDWSVNSFKLATSGVNVATQIHTHLCYSEFEVVLPAIIALNADVTSIEAARSKMEIVENLVQAKYPLGVGPGVYDIHSPRIPSVEEMTELLESAANAFKAGGLPISDLWVNPDCGLKTRKDAESTPSLRNMVEATKIVRATL